MESKQKETESKEAKSLKHYFDFGPVLGYFFRKKNPDDKPGFNLRMMHGINKISILMFLAALIITLIKVIFWY